MAQDNSADKVLSLKEFYAQIITHHPIVKQAQLLNEFARLELRIARGGFDPKIQLDYSKKDFDKKNYYDLLNSKFKIPLWIGELQAGFENNSGVFLDPSSTTDPAGLTSVGIAIPIGQGLMMDNRRATLKQARYFQEIADADKIKEINKILLNASKDYWDWYFKQQQFIFTQVGVAFAEQRYLGVRQRVFLGELAAIDSVQAKIVLQERQIQLQQATVELLNARISIANYLWTNGDTPLLLAEEIIPETFATKLVSESDYQNLLNFSKENHPDIRKTQFKLRQLEVEEKLQMNNLLPTLNLNYNLLSNVQPADEYTRFNTQNNYKLGVQFEFPLFLRKERGKLQQVRVKQTQTNFELSQTIRNVQNTLQTSYNELANLAQQIVLLEDMVANYVILRDGELRRFANGESSLFLVNTQESKLIEAQIKLESQKSKYGKARANLIWASGGQTWE